MSQDQPVSNPEPSWERVRLCPQSPEELERAIDLAFDYRGDVTLELRGAPSIEGYLFSRKSDPPEPFVELYFKDQMEKRTVKYSEIAAVVFTGEDTAQGKSWEAWIKKKKEEGQKKK